MQKYWCSDRRRVWKIRRVPRHYSGNSQFFISLVTYNNDFCTLQDFYENNLAAALTYTDESNYDPKFNGRKGLWIGFIGDRTPDSVDWRWDHAESFTTFTNWAAGEPNALSDARTCTYMSIDGLWHTNDCSERLSYLCKASEVVHREPDIRGDYLSCDVVGDGWFASSEQLDDTHGHHCIKAFANLKTFDAAKETVIETSYLKLCKLRIEILKEA